MSIWYVYTTCITLFQAGVGPHLVLSPESGSPFSWCWLAFNWRTSSLLQSGISSPLGRKKHGTFSLGNCRTTHAECDIDGEIWLDGMYNWQNDMFNCAKSICTSITFLFSICSFVLASSRKLHCGGRTRKLHAENFYSWSILCYIAADFVPNLDKNAL